MRTVLRKLSVWDSAKLAFFLFVVLGTSLVFVLTPTLLPSALVSMMLFFIFAPIIDSLERKGIPRGSAILGLFLVGGLMLMAGASWLTPRISKEVDSFQRGTSRYTAGVTERLKAQEARVFGDTPMLKDANFTDLALRWLRESSQKIWATIPNVASHAFMMFLLVPFFSFILLKDAHEIRRALLKLVPNRYFETTYGLTARILDEMGGYVAARIIEALFMMAMVTIGCLIFKIPYAFLLGVFAAATNAIPYLGPLIGAVPGLLLAVVEPSIPSQLFLISSIYVIANLIDITVIFPLVVAKIVDLHPALVVISVVLGSQIFGVVGMIVAVPITSILKILIQEAYSRVYNHDHGPQGL